MSHVSFYRKWRPQTFEDVFGQERVTRTLQNAIASNRIVHAYLFCGYRGTGKTTTARLLAKALNCERGPTPTPCNVCVNCRAISDGTSLDVIEIDAASNRGIDEIRDLREKITRVPVGSRYNVYIIDEAHMLTTEAANALLKTLEEPPAHAVLVLVTTEPHRLPPTITSRTQRFDFKRIPQATIVDRLRTIAASEGFTVEEDALHLIARSADGALRDAESLLDQLGAFCQGAVTTADVLAVLGVIEEEVTQQLTDAIIAGDGARCLVMAGRVIDEGRDVRQILRSLIEQFRDLLVVAVVEDPRGVVETSDARLASLRAQSARLSPAAIIQKIRLLAAAEAEARLTTQPRIALEMALLRVSRPEMDPTLDGLTARVEALERRGDRPADDGAALPPLAETPAADATSHDDAGQGRRGGASRSATPRTAGASRRAASRGDAGDGSVAKVEEPRAGAPAGSPPEPAGARDAAAPERPSAWAPPGPEGRADAGDTASEGGVSIELLRARWGHVMEEVKQRTRTVHAFLLESTPRELSGTELVLGVRHRFHMESLQDLKTRRIVEDALARVLGAPMRVRFTLDDTPAPPLAEAPPEEPGAAGDVLVSEAVRRFGNPVQEVRRSE
ncbi:MAG TPA: DNA polymerase III subunit gamma/tau [bacterium]|nr:DNA polymerase III subunit gamma/tau [bacterium]